MGENESVYRRINANDNNAVVSIKENIWIVLLNFVSNKIHEEGRIFLDIEEDLRSTITVTKMISLI